MKPFDFLDLIGDVPEDLVKSCAAALTIPGAQISRPARIPRIITGTAAAACIAAVAGTGYLLRDHGLTQQSSDLDSAMQQVTAISAQTTVSAASSQTAAASEHAASSETTAASAQTETVSAPSEPVTVPTETALEEAAGQPGTAAQPAGEPEIIGDLDLDGSFTPADCLWAELIFSAELDSVSDTLPLSDAQLRQCELIADDFRSPVGEAEYNAFQRIAQLIVQCETAANLNVREYLSQQAYYDDCFRQIQDAAPKEWEDSRIDWTALGLPEHPTEAAFYAALSWKYALEHSEKKDEMSADEIAALRKKCLSNAKKYREMKAALYVTPEQTPEQQAYSSLAGRIHLFVRNRHTEQYGEAAWSWFSDTENAPAPTWDELLAELDAAKNWDFRFYHA